MLWVSRFDLTIIVSIKKTVFILELRTLMEGNKILNWETLARNLPQSQFKWKDWDLATLIHLKTGKCNH